jgi:hypothetical protein
MTLNDFLVCWIIDGGMKECSSRVEEVLGFSVAFRTHSIPFEPATLWQGTIIISRAFLKTSMTVYFRSWM